MEARGNAAVIVEATIRNCLSVGQSAKVEGVYGMVLAG